MKNNMPSKGLYLTLHIFCFLFGVLWGILTISAYSNMKKAIASGDRELAWRSANKILIFFFVGLAVNLLLIAIQFRR